NRERSTAGIRYWRGGGLVISQSLTKPTVGSTHPQRFLLTLCSASACASCSRVIRPSLIRMSPSRSEPAAAVAIVEVKLTVEVGNAGATRDSHARCQLLRHLQPLAHAIDQGRFDAGNAKKCISRPERAVALPVPDDGLRPPGPDAWEGLELGGAGPVERNQARCMGLQRRDLPSDRA